MLTLILASVKREGRIDPNKIHQEFVLNLTPFEAALKLEKDYSVSISQFMANEMKRVAGKRFIPLLTDPSISSRFDIFLGFLERNPNVLKLGPIGCHNAFRESLGRVKTYRAIGISDIELEQLKKHGFICSIIRDAPSLWRDDYQRFCPGLRENIIEHIFHPETKSTLISVSELPELAVSATSQHLTARRYPAKEIWLFPLELHEFDTLRFSWYLSTPNGQDDPSYEKYFNSITVLQNGKHFWTFDPSAELFLPYAISPRNIDFANAKRITPEQIYGYAGLSGQETPLSRVSDEYTRNLIESRRGIFIPELGNVEIFSIPNLLEISGSIVLAGSAEQNPFKHPEIPIFIDSRFFHRGDLVKRQISIQMDEIKRPGLREKRGKYQFPQSLEGTLYSYCPK